MAVTTASFLVMSGVFTCVQIVILRVGTFSHITEHFFSTASKQRDCEQILIQGLIAAADMSSR